MQFNERYQLIRWTYILITIYNQLISQFKNIYIYSPNLNVPSQEGETVQIRIEPGVTMSGAHSVELTESTEEMDEGNHQNSVDAEGHENSVEVQQHDGAIVLAGGEDTHKIQGSLTS